jgi:CheY-like chemotaxis protein
MKRTYTPTKPKKILIVDDDRVVVSAYQNKLESDRYTVEIASNGEQALRTLKILPVDLVILDFSIPGMNGEEVLNAIRSQSGTEALPVIVFTNAHLPALAQSALKAGATRCIRKSDSTPNQILAIVRELFATDAKPAEVSTGANAVALPINKIRRVHSAESATIETIFEARLVADFLAAAPRRLVSLRNAHHAFVHSQQDDLPHAQLFEMHRQARLLAGGAVVVGLRKIAQLASASDALLLRVWEKRANITPSVVRTIAQAVDLLALLLDHPGDLETEELVAPAVLVVDDEIISREAVCAAIEKAGLCAVSLDNPMQAEALLRESHFDLIFLDVEMPGQSGLELCASIRKTAMNRTTPVIFVTAHSDFASRAQSSLSGGNDFIAKPFLSVELAVKALTWLCKARLTPISMAARPAEKNIDQPPSFEVVTDGISLSGVRDSLQPVP